MKRTMNKYKNEDGYVLIVVILLVVLIMGFSSVFMTNAISHTKQEEAVDQQHLTVAAAEMGVEYYTEYLENNYNNLYYELVNDYSSFEKRDCVNNRTISADNFQTIFIECIYHPVLNEISVPTPILNSYVYVLEGINEEGMTEENKMQLKGNILGEKNELGNKVTKNLNFKMSFYVPEFEVDSGSGIPDLDEQADFIQYYNENKPEKECPIFSSKENIDNENCYITFGLDSHKSFIDNSKIFIGTNYETKNGFEIKNNSNIFVTNDLVAENTQFEMIDSRLLVGRNMEVKNNFDLSNSKLLVRGNFDSKNNFELINNSTLYIGGNLKGRNNFKVSSNSKVCVEGSFTFENNITISEGGFYVLGNFNASKATGVTKVNSIEELKEICNVGASTEGIDPPTFNPRVDDVEYDF